MLVSGRVARDSFHSIFQPTQETLMSMLRAGPLGLRGDGVVPMGFLKKNVT